MKATSQQRTSTFRIVEERAIPSLPPGMPIEPTLISPPDPRHDRKGILAGALADEVSPHLTDVVEEVRDVRIAAQSAMRSLAGSSVARAVASQFFVQLVVIGDAARFFGHNLRPAA